MVFEPGLFIYSETPGFLLPKVSNITGLLNSTFTDILINNTGTFFIILTYNRNTFIINIPTALVTPTPNLILK